MYIVAGIEFVLYVMLYWKARKEILLQEIKGVKRPFYCMAQYIYKKYALYFPKVFENYQIKQDLQRLYPGQKLEKVCAVYYVNKITLFLLIVLAGTIFCTMVYIKADTSRKITEEGTIQRGSYQEEAAKVTVSASVKEQEKQTFKIEVYSQTLEKQEAETLCIEFMEKLPELIKGENLSLEEVTKDLSLLESYDDYPFSVIWHSNQSIFISDTGSVYPSEEPCKVLLTADITYESWTWTKEISVVVTTPFLSEEERFYQELSEFMIESEAVSREEKEWKLPEKWKGQEITWTEEISDNSLFLWVGILTVSLLVYLSADKDLHNTVERKKQQMKAEYPDIVQKLVLYLGAGMTIRGVFGKLAEDYEEALQQGKPKNPVYEEICYTCRQLQTGISEISAYEFFGKRTGLQEYVRMSTLLTQNLKKGNHMLLTYLEEEAAKAMEEQLQGRRKLGEEASTKLLVPMVMMLAVVMIIIMIPAFSSVG